MKATKKIVGAACALVAAVALSAGSTFAWFSSNGTVTATGLEIDVNTTNSYLIIAKDTAGLAAGAKELTMAPDNNSAKLLPSAYQDIKAVDETTKKVTTEDKTLEGGTAGGKSVVTESTWYTCQGIDSDNGLPEQYKVGDNHPTDVYAVGDTVDGNTLAAGDALVGKPKKLEDGDPLIGTWKTVALEAGANSFDKYVIVSDIVVSISKGSTAVENVNVTMQATVTAAAKDCPIKIVFLYQTVAPKAGDTPAWGDLGAWTKVDATVTGGLGASAGLDLGGIDSSDHYIAVKVMVYMDGNEAEMVKTTNSLNLTGCTIGFTFNDQEAA